MWVSSGKSVVHTPGFARVWQGWTRCASSDAVPRVMHNAKRERMKKALEEAAMRRRGDNMTTANLDIDTPRGPTLGAVAKRALSPTGGEGTSRTSESDSYQAACAKTRSLYRSCLKEVPEIRRNFFLVEDEKLLRDTLKWMFMQHATVRDPRIIDVLVFKGSAELEEYQRQWKGRHHLYQHVAAYQANLQRQKNADLLRKLDEETGSDDPAHASDSKKKTVQLETWKAHKLIPSTIDTWAQYVVWRREEDERFAQFAEEHGLFTREELEKNRKVAFERGMIPI